MVSGHPAQVHNLRLVRAELIKHGHNVYWLTTPKDIATNLLEIYDIPYTLLRKPKRNIFSVMWTMLSNVALELCMIRKYKIDFAVTRICPYTCLAAKLAGIPHITMSDTEHSVAKTKILSDMASSIFVPDCFSYLLRKDQMYFAGNIELFYLHPNRFKPSAPYEMLGIEPTTRYAIVRFVKWNAHHDVGLEEGFRLENKVRMVKELAKHVRVFVSAEANEVPAEIEPYLIKIPLERMHDVLAYADLIIGESATMASESVVLGTPAIYVDPVGRGYTDEEAARGLLYMYKPAQQLEAIEKAVEIVSPGFDKEGWNQRHTAFLDEKIDCTAWLTWLIENYPRSVEEYRTNRAEIEKRFR